MSSHILSDAELKVQLDILRDASPRGMAVYDIGMAVRDLVEEKVRRLGLEGVLAESVPWSDATFPEATIESITTHLKREWKELEESGFQDPAEFADVVLLMAHLAYKKFFRLEKAVRDKFEVNKKRKWGKVDSEGVVEHIRHEEENRGPGHVEHWDGTGDHPTVYHMKMGPDGRPYGIGSTQQKEANVYSPPVLPHYRVRVEQGQTIFEKLIFWHVNGHEHSWKAVDNIHSGSEADIRIFAKLQTLVDMGCVTPIELTVHVTVMGELTEPTLNERWEKVVETSNGKYTGRVGRLRRYRKGGKEYAGAIEWDKHVHFVDGKT